MKFIAEFCQNHNGDFKILSEMVVRAADAGATYGKMQTIYSKNLTFRPEFEKGIEIDGNVHAIRRPFQDEFNRLKGLEISLEDSKKFVDLCKKNNLVPITTCFARSNMQEIIEAGFKSVKIASYDCSSFQMIRELKDHFDEIIISTGATYDDEIKLAADILKEKNFSILHCVTQYPTPLDSMNLARMQWLKKYSDSFGLSDHSNVARDGVLACKAALYMGAEILERHFTILPADQTKDGPVSITPDHLKDLVEFSKLSKDEMHKVLNKNYPDWKKMIGLKKREMTNEEILNRNYYRGRFASPTKTGRMIYNWEELPV